MEFNEYQKLAYTTAKYPAIGHMCVYPALGLANEAGEVLGKVKKVFRDNNGDFSQDRLDAIKSEIGDTLWYCACLAQELGFDLNSIAEGNLVKLKIRDERGTIKGDGDER